jgi:hypothetical protein
MEEVMECLRDWRRAMYIDIRNWIPRIVVILMRSRFILVVVMRTQLGLYYRPSSDREASKQIYERSSAHAMANLINSGKAVKAKMQGLEGAEGCDPAG